MSAAKTDRPGAPAGAGRRAGRIVAVAVVVAVFMALVCRLWILEPVAVESDSMEPTVGAGSLVFVFKPGPELFGVHSGDLVVFPSPADGTPVIKRVVAVGGQQIEVQDAVLYVDSSPVAEPFVDLATIDGTYYPLTEVPAGTVFVMGDNRERSIDSRDYGPVPIWKALTAWSWDRSPEARPEHLSAAARLSRAATASPSRRAPKRGGRKPKAEKPRFLVAFLVGAPKGIRTPDLLFRRQTLYPAELWAHIQFGPCLAARPRTTIQTISARAKSGRLGPMIAQCLKY